MQAKNTLNVAATVFARRLAVVVISANVARLREPGDINPESSTNSA
jgi:hypothetical protein